MEERRWLEQKKKYRFALNGFSMDVVGLKLGFWGSQLGSASSAGGRWRIVVGNVVFFIAVAAVIFCCFWGFWFWRRSLRPLDAGWRIGKASGVRSEMHSNRNEMHSNRKRPPWRWRRRRFVSRRAGDLTKSERSSLALAFSLQKGKSIFFLLLQK